MVAALGLTSDFVTFFAAYCTNPPPDDGCPYGFCPNTEIAGESGVTFYTILAHLCSRTTGPHISISH